MSKRKARFAGSFQRCSRSGGAIQLPGVADSRRGDAGPLTRRFDVIRHEIDQVRLVALRAERLRVRTCPAADVEDTRRRWRQMPAQQFHGAYQLELPDGVG